MEKINWNKVIDSITVFVLGIVLLILVVCTVVLLMFDSLVGAGSMMVLTNAHMGYSAFISMATTGMTIALAFMAYLASARKQNGLSIAFGVAAAIVAGIDVYFDSLTADYLRYGMFMTLQNIQHADRTVQVLYRVLIGGMSLIGEPLAVAIIMGMPELKKFIAGVLPMVQQRQPTQHTQPTYNQYPPMQSRSNGRHSPGYGQHGREGER